MSYKGKYKLKNPQKYKGDPLNVIYRSLWERKYMVYCDTSSEILEWSSEEKSIPYRSPSDGKIHRYYPDFLIKRKELDGAIKKYMIEIKPKKQTLPPPKPKRQTQKYLNEVFTYAKNQSKWEAAREWCADNGYIFQVLTEKELNIRR
ncbi:MAG: Prochlorococcus phage [Bacteroidota bacterium]